MKIALLNLHYRLATATTSFDAPKCSSRPGGMGSVLDLMIGSGFDSVSCTLPICPNISGWSLSICSCRSDVNRICRLWWSLSHFICLHRVSLGLCVICWAQESKKSVRDLHTGLNVIVILYPTSIRHYIFHGIYTICQNPPYAPPISRTNMPISGVPQHPLIVYTIDLLRYKIL